MDKLRRFVEIRTDKHRSSLNSTAKALMLLYLWPTYYKVVLTKKHEHNSQIKYYLLYSTLHSSLANNSKKQITVLKYLHSTLFCLIQCP